MKKGIKYFVLLIVMSTQFSCEEWIELFPENGLIRDEFWKTKEDVEAVLMGAYQNFASMDARLFHFGEMRGDMVTDDISLNSSIVNIMEGNIYADNWLVNWSNFYEVINYANEVIKNAPLVQEIDDTYTDYQLKSIMSEAYFIRGLAYFYLVRIYKDVPFVLEPSESDDSDFYPAKSDGSYILESIVAELEENRQYAPSEYSTTEDSKGRATKAAYDALIADIALWLFDYDKCINYCNNVLAMSEYELMPSIKFFEIFYPGNSLEGIFEFQFDQQNDQSNSTYGLTYEDGYNYDPSQKAIEMFAADYGVSELNRGDDAAIAKVGDEDYIIWKYVGRSGDGISTRSGTMEKSCNWIVYRLADVYLMKAEALSQLGQFTEAANLINEIRDRAGVASLAIANSKTAYEDAIMEERALELAFEGKRWFDLVRMGSRDDYARKSELIEIIIQNVPSTQKRILATKLTNPLGWYMPIYEDEIERNPALVQNSYYKF